MNTNTKQTFVKLGTLPNDTQFDKINLPSIKVSILPDTIQFRLPNDIQFNKGE